MKKLFFLLAMMLTAVGAFAQEYYSAAVIAKLIVTNAPQDIGADGASYCIRAYVGDKTENTFYYEEWPQMIYGDDATPGAVSNGFMGYMFRIGTNPTGVSGESDAGKTIHFELLDQSKGITFIYPLSKTLVFPSSDATYGSASEPIEFEITFPEELEINLKEIELNKSYTLANYLQVTPKEATLPSNVEWVVGAEGDGENEFADVDIDPIDGISIVDGVLKAETKANQVLLRLAAVSEPSPVAGSMSMSLTETYINVVVRPTAITPTSTDVVIENTEYGRYKLRQMFTHFDGFTITPNDADHQPVEWEIQVQKDANGKEIPSILSWDGRTFSLEEGKDGEAYIRPYVSYYNANTGKTITIYPKDAQGNDLWVKVTVVIPVESVYADYSIWGNYGFRANVFDKNIAERLAKMVTVLPYNATEKGYHFEVDADQDGLTISDGKITATKSGDFTVKVVSEGNSAETAPDATSGDGSPTLGQPVETSIRVRIEDPHTAATFEKNPLTIPVSDDDRVLITDKITSNIQLNGNKEEVAMGNTCTVDVTAGTTVTREEVISPEGGPSDFDFYAQGNEKDPYSTITVTLSWIDWASWMGYQMSDEGAPTGAEPGYANSSASFRVLVSQSFTLTGFAAKYAAPVTDQEVVVTLTPIPENATFTPDDINVTFELDASAYANNQTLVAAFQRWAAKALKDVKKVSATKSEIKWKFTSAVPGNVTIKVTNGTGNAATAGPEEVPVYQNGVEYNIINVGYEMAFDKDWQWRSNAWGYIDYSDVSTVFGGNALAEIRTVDHMLFNEEGYGMFGSFANAQADLGAYKCYKVKMNAESSYVMYSNIAATLKGIPEGIAYDRRSGNVTITLNSGWNWMGYPYFFNRNLNKVMSAATSSSQVTIPDQLVVVGKQGFATYDGTTSTFKGSLEYLEAGQGYLVYNPGDGFSVTFPVELMWDAEDEGFNTQNVKAFGLGGRVWNYDHRRFMNNMAMVAVLDGIENPQDYSVGAFVGDECRGEGFVQDGTIFLTVHCDAGEFVNFKLYNTLTGETEDIQEGVRAQMRIGSYNSPFLLHAATTGIQTVDEAARQADTYDLTGRRAGNVQRGVTIRRMADGSVRKVIVK